MTRASHLKFARSPREKGSRKEGRGIAPNLQGLLDGEGQPGGGKPPCLRRLGSSRGVLECEALRRGGESETYAWPSLLSFFLISGRVKLLNIHSIGSAAASWQFLS